ncbi:MAG: hypothetical protein KGJ89_05190 [Patescibacteria group bacterium]|nr:hypothetical protein [Patescibacteria group bacterium]MDE2227317.1 hypothetical protein [Patescibacteria group bacterium]
MSENINTKEKAPETGAEKKEEKVSFAKRLEAVEKAIDELREMCLRPEPKAEEKPIILNKKKAEDKAAELRSGIGAHPGGDWKWLNEAYPLGPIAVAILWNRKDGEVKLYSSRFFE